MLPTHRQGIHPIAFHPMQLLTFFNAFSLLNDANKLAVFTVGAKGCHLAHCSPSCLPAGATPAPGAAAAAGLPSVAVLEGLKRALTATATSEAGPSASTGAFSGHCQLSGGLSRTLCYINSQQRRAAAAAAGLGGDAALDLPGSGAGQRRRLQARLLCLVAAPDVPSQYISVMNAIFSAQRSGVLIDACHLGHGHSTFLQQVPPRRTLCAWDVVGNHCALVVLPCSGFNLGGPSRVDAGSTPDRRHLHQARQAAGSHTVPQRRPTSRRMLPLR
jgi:hypothetical protein